MMLTDGYDLMGTARLHSTYARVPNFTLNCRTKEACFSFILQTWNTLVGPHLDAYPRSTGTRMSQCCSSLGSTLG